MNVESLVGIGDGLCDVINNWVNIRVTGEGIEGGKWVSEFKVDKDKMRKPFGYIHIDTNVKGMFVFKKPFTKTLLVFMHYLDNLFYIETNDKKYMEKYNPKYWRHYD